MNNKHKPPEHKELIARGYKLVKVLKGFFKEYGKEIISPVYYYKREHGHTYMYKCVSRFGVYTY